MGEQRRRARGLTRRQVLVGGAVLGGAAALGVTSTGSPFAGGNQTVSFWHLFGGGDGERLTEILADIDAEHPDSDVRELILPWGNPYYTKLALASVGGSPPDVAVVHATRLPSFAPAGLLEELTPELLARHDLQAERFLEQPWKSGQSRGRQYAIPLDTHPFVLYYNTELVEKAGLLDGGKLRSLDGPDALLEAGEAVKKETGKTGLVFETRGVTPWRIFLTLYEQLGGPPIIEEGGSRIGMDDKVATRALEWMTEPHKRGVGGPDVDYQGSVAFFGNGTAAFALNGEWEVTTFQAMKMKFGMTTVPKFFDRAANQADAHTFVIPRNANRSPERLDAALAFISRLVRKGLDWAKGGHVPAFREVFESEEYRKLSPQSNYAEAAERVVFDPLAWYSGSGSNLETNAGSAFKPVITGAQKPEQGLATFRDYLERMSKTERPV
jgi:multiple sugar transport system substrate-binding protein